jgi:type I restriction enzyme S subunit
VRAPDHWSQSTVGEINLFESRAVSPSRYRDEVFELYSVPAFPLNKPELLPGAEINSNKQEVRPGDVLICKINPRINRVWTVGPRSTHRQIASSEWIGVRSPEFEADFLRWYFSSGEFRQLLTENVVGVGGSLTRSQPKVVSTLPVPVPPRLEQVRIAARLGTLLSRAASTRAHLDRAFALLKRFRQAVLEAGVSGELTAEWRGTALPSWPLERADSVCAKVQSGGTPKTGFIQEPGIPFLKVYNLASQRIDFDSRPQFVDVAVHQGELRKSECLPGDVLMNIVGPPLGKVAIVPATSPRWNINQALVLFRPNKRITSKWLYFLLCSGRNIDEIQHETKGSAGQVNISLSQCRAFEFPVPSSQEQDEIVRRVEALFTFAGSLEARIEAARAQVERLTPALLAKALRGELVPQDPAEGTGSELLARIRAEKTPSRKVRRMPRRTEKRVDSDIERPASSFSILEPPVPPPPDPQVVKSPIRDSEDAEARIRGTEPLLVEVLRRLDGRAAPLDLWQASPFRNDIDGFYAQLRAEISAGLLVEKVLDDNRRMIEIVRKLPTSEAGS